MRFVAFGGLFAPVVALAQEPVQLAYSGRLVDVDGEPYNTQILLDISLHTAETGGSLVHDEQFTLTPADGYFAVMLGEDTIDDPLYATEIPTTGGLWVQLVVDGTPLGGRARVASSPRSAAAAASLIGIAESGGVRTWSDGSVATSCDAYRHPPAGKVYSGATGDGVYRIDPDGAGTNTAFDVVCDMTRDGGGWTLILKAAGSDFAYDSSHWTTATTLNPTSLTTTHGQSAKYRSFNELPADELMITAWNGGRTQLGLPSSQTALALFQATGQPLFVTGGARTPAELINGRDYTHCGAAWRTNSYVSGSGVRLGGYVYYVWDCNYGTDASGNETGAHLLGFGTRDTRWTPNTGANKSFGVRDAHDHTYIPPGQAAQSAHLWAR